MKNLLRESSLDNNQMAFVVRHSQRAALGPKLHVFMWIVLASYFTAASVMLVEVFYPEDVSKWMDNLGSFCGTVSLLFVNLGGVLMLASLIHMSVIDKNPEKRTELLDWLKSSVRTYVPNTFDTLWKWMFHWAYLCLFVAFIMSGYKWSAIWLGVVWLFNTAVSNLQYSLAVRTLQSMTTEELADSPKILPNGLVLEHKPTEAS